MKPFVGLKNIWYGEPLAKELNKANLKEWIGKAHEVKNIHQDTWGYSESDPKITEYVNQLTGSPYFRDIESAGNKTISFTLGEFQIDEKIDLQGGSKVMDNADVLGWAPSEKLEIIEKGIVAKTKTGNYIVFSNASIIATGKFVQKNIGLGVSAVAQESPVENVRSMYLLDGEVADKA